MFTDTRITYFPVRCFLLIHLNQLFVDFSIFLNVSGNLILL